MSWDAALFVALAFLLFVGAVIYFGLHNKINEMLDKRAAAIKAELDEATRLRGEAAALLASFEQKKVAAQAEAQVELFPGRERGLGVGADADIVQGRERRML